MNYGYMKRIICLCMGVTLAVGAVTGCGSETSSGEAVASASENEASKTGIIESKIDEAKSQTTSSDDYNKRMQALVDALTPMWENSGKYPSAWNLSDLYADEAEFNKDYDEVLSWIESFADYEGTLSDKDVIYNYFHSIQDEVMIEKYNSMLLYSELGAALDITDKYYKNLQDKIKTLEEKYSKATSFAPSEIMSIPYEQRLEIFEDPMFEDMSYYLSYYMNPDSEDLPKSVRDEIASLKKTKDKGREDYEKYRYTSRKVPEFTTPELSAKGMIIELTDDNYAVVMQSASEREIKISAYETYNQGFIDDNDLYAEFLEETASANWKIAKEYGYESTLAMKASEDCFSEEVFRYVINSAHKSAVDYKRYARAHAKALGLDEQYLFDLEKSASDYVPDPVSYDEAVDVIGASVAILGSDYQNTLLEIVSESSIDAGRADNRSASTFTMSQGKINMPYVFINFYGEYADVSNFAHEMGHAMNYRLSSINQPLWYTSVSTFDTEVCSIMHEILLNAYMVENADSNSEKLYYLEKLLNIYNTAFFTQCMYSELEDYIYKNVEAGKPLDGQMLDDKMMKLLEVYRGDAIDGKMPEWERIDHLHYGYYMYKYATSICYASALADKILSGNQSAIKAYKEFMGSGSSDDPVTLLEKAGVNPLDTATYNSASKYYRSLVDEYEKLIGEVNNDKIVREE